MWETWMKYLALGFGLAPAVAMWEMNQRVEEISVSIFPLYPKSIF